MNQARKTATEVAVGSAARAKALPIGASDPSHSPLANNSGIP